MLYDKQDIDWWEGELHGRMGLRKIKDREVVGSVQGISGHFYDRIITYMYCLKASCLIPCV